MKKFKINATLITTMKISQIVESISLQEATAKLLKTTNTKDWVTTQELKTCSK